MEKEQPSNPAGVTGRLCTWIHDLKMGDIPQDIMTRAKYLLLDGLTCAIGASHLPWSEVAVNGVLSMEEQGPCTLIGWANTKLPPLQAALLNSTFTQGFELDDWHSKAPIHSAAVITPALFAVAELAAARNEQQTETICSGRAFLEAFIVGCEVGPRVGLALHGTDLLARGWHSGAVQGPSAAAAAVASLLSFTPRETEWALGTACTQAGGLMAAQYGSMVKRMQHGFAARNGVFAALMARQGYSGIEEVYDLPFGGFISVFSQGTDKVPQSLPEDIVAGLGEQWEIERIRVKLYAAMAVLHGAIECIVNLQQAHASYLTEANLGNIESITTEHGNTAFKRGGWEMPQDKPVSSTAAQMSVRYAVAAQLVDREVLMAQYGAEKLNRPLIREIMKKIDCRHNPKIDEEGSKFATILQIRFKDKTVIRKQVENPRGIDPAVTNEEIIDKWQRLTRGLLDDERRQSIEKCIMDLEHRDIRELIALLAVDIPCAIDTAEEDDVR